jgi:hypothetical protein
VRPHGTQLAHDRAQLDPHPGLATLGGNRHQLGRVPPNIS